MSGRFQGRVVVITGAASGQGRSGAMLFAREGARLALCDRNAEGLAVTADLVTSQFGVDVLTQDCDLTNVSAIESFATKILDRFHVVDVVYNNAGVMARLSIDETESSNWDEIQAINVRAPFFLVKYLMPGLKASKSASVINVSSIAGVTPPREGNTAYATSKGALIALTRAQARDLAPLGIRVNCLVPGAIDTPMPAGAFEAMAVERQEEARALAVSRSLIKRWGTADEVAAVAVFLASAEASYMTGAIVPVDGGWTAC
jgi:2-keto-3-deoxy-L-fuconate dehydrogenase